MRLVLLDAVVEASERANTDGYIFLLGQTELFSSLDRNADELAKKLTSGILVSHDPSSYLKVELQWNTPSDFNTRASSTSDGGGIFKKLKEHFRDDVTVGITVKSPLAHENYVYFEAQGLAIHPETHSVHTARELIRYADWARLRIKMFADIPDQILPSIFLSELEDRTGFRDFLGEGTVSDVTIETKDGGQLPCHRLLLSAFSPVFRFMLQCDMMEFIMTDMKELNANAVKALFRYIYYGETNWPKESIEHAYDLLYLADKYHVSGFLPLVILFLVELQDNDIPVKIAFTLYTFVKYMREARMLETKLLRIIKGNLAELEPLPEYRQFIRSNANAMDLSRGIAETS